jgi:superfamily II DNA or RNA helicase
MSVEVTFDYEPKKRTGVLISDIFPEVREHFSVKAPKFGAARFNKYIPDRKYVITPTGRFKIGLYWEIYKYIRSNYPNTSFTFTEAFRSAVLQGYEASSVVDRGLRDYQNEIVGKCLKMGTGTVVLATAGGKTFTMASLVESINPLKGIIIVPDPGLVEQTYNDFLKYGIAAERVSRWTGEHALNQDAQVIIANRSILQSKSSDIEWIKFVDLVIVDEVQSLKKDNGITDIVSKILTLHKYGFTGTLPENDIDRWTIMGITGPMIYERKAHELREEKYVAESKALILNVKYKTLPPPKPKSNPNEQYREEVEWLIRNEFRNKLITKLCGNFKNNALLLVDRLEHGEVLKAALEGAHPDRRVFFINGEMEMEDREKVKKLMEQESNVLCVAMAKIFAVGISINNLHYIVFCSGGKSRIRVIQSIGRGLRLHESKLFLTIVDIADQTKYGIKHSDKRKLLYIEEKIPFTETSVVES